MWWDGHPETGLYNHVMPPNTWSCDDSNNSWVNDAAASTASSRHPGVVNVLMCDGSVRAIKGTIAPTIWWALGSRLVAKCSLRTTIETAHRNRVRPLP